MKFRNFAAPTICNLGFQIFRKSAARQILLIGSIALLTTSCEPIVTPTLSFDPPQGNLPSANSSVNLIVPPTTTEVYVTTDGTEPTTSCDLFDTSIPIPINQNLQVKVLIVTAGIEYSFTSTYTVPDGAPLDSFTNAEVITAWDEYFLHIQSEIEAVGETSAGLWYAIDDGFGGKIRFTYTAPIITGLFDSEAELTALLQFDGYSYGGITVDGDPELAPTLESFAEVESHAKVKFNNLTQAYISSSEEYIRSNSTLYISGDYTALADGDFLARYDPDLNALVIASGTYTISCSNTNCAPDEIDIVYAFIGPNDYQQITEVYIDPDATLIPCNANP
ncbi:MAG: chitobiase/beta-hexosaminidase C-terminal domain-containing protein [Pseudomonadales bacterium]|nr:chitobiase/beta-hexosaminidase C-terminal domain-containing protein [Pseudomonadales bacterium]